MEAILKLPGKELITIITIVGTNIHFHLISIK